MYHSIVQWTFAVYMEDFFTRLIIKVQDQEVLTVTILL